MGRNHDAPRRPGAGALRDLLVISLCAAVLFDLGQAFHVFDRVYGWVETSPHRVNQVFAVFALLTLGFAVFAARRWREASREMAARSEAEERHRALVEHIPAITYTWDPTKPTGTVAAPYISPQIESVLGFTQEEWQADPGTWLRQVHPEDYDRVVEASDRSDRTGEPFNIEYRMIAKDGRVLWIRDEAIVVEWDESGRPSLVQGVMYDVSERKRAEQHVQEAEARYRTLVERVPAVTYIWDASHPTGTVSAPYVSPQIESMLGFTQEEWQADPMMWHHQVHPEDREWVLAGWETSDREGTPFRSEYRMLRKDGRTVWVRDEAVAVSRDDHGRPLFQGVMFDISERRRAEERLREAETRYRTLVEQTPAVVYISGTLGQEQDAARYIAPRIEQVLGFTAGEWIADPDLWQRQIHPDDRDQVLAEARRTDATGEPFSAEYRMLHHDGRVVWVRDEAVLVAGEGTGTAWQGVYLDITRRKEAEARLTEAETRYRTLVEQIPAVTYMDAVSDEDPADASPVYISPQILDLVGYTPEEWVADPDLWGKLVHPDDRDPVQEAGDRARLSGQPFSAEYRMVSRDGRSLWVREASVLVTDETGRPRFWQGVISDITEQKLGEEKLREAEARYRRLVEQLPAVVYIDAVDDLSTALYVSPQYERLLGFTAEERMKAPDLWLRRLHPEDRDRVVAESLRTNESGDPFTIEYRMLHKDGSVVWIRDEAFLVRDREGKPLYWQGVLLDITERRRAEETLRRREAILQAVGFAAEGFLKTGSWEDVVQEVLERLGQAAGVSRVYVFRNERDEDGGLLMTELREWVAPGIRSTLGDPANTRFPYRGGGFSRWEEQLGGGRIIHGTRADFPGAERLDMEDEDILSMAVVPVFLGEEWWGFMGFDDCRTERAWSQAEIDALKAAADTLGAAIGRERAEARVQEAEAQYRTLVERIPAVVYFAPFGEAVPWLYVSPQIESILGYTAEEWMAWPELWLEVIHPDDLERVLREENHSRDTGEPLLSEYRMRTRDRRIVWIRDEAKVVRGEGDDPGFLRGILYDITDRKQAEEQMHEAEVRYRTLVEQLPAAAYIDALDAGAPTLYISPQIESMLGYSPEEWTSNPTFWTEHLHRDDLEGAVAANIAHNETGEPFELEYRMIARDGRVVWVRDQAVVVRDEHGEPRFSQGIIADITERKQAEELLRETEARYRALVEQIPAVLYIDLPDDRMTPIYVSPQVESLLGVPPDRYVAEDLWAALVHPDDRERAVRGSLEGVASNNPFSQEYRMVTSDGRALWIHDHSVVLRDEQGRPTVVQGVMSDITERKLAEEALQESERREREAAERLRTLDEMKNTFLAAVSHELRSPLTSILGLSLTLEQQRLPQPDQADLLSRLATNARKLDRLLKDLLDIDRLNRGIVTPQYRPTDIGALVRRTVESLELPAERSIQMEAPTIVIPVDPAKVERIVENLLVNATRHTTSDTGVWVCVRPRDGGVLIVVEDDGPGVPPELRQDIFEPFRQGPTASPHSPGTGIGLSLVKMFAELHGGQAWVEDREGGGASFRVFLPGVAPDPNGGPDGNGGRSGTLEATTLDPAGAG